MKSRLALRSNCVLLSNRLAGQLQIEMLERRTLLSAGALIDTFGTHGIATTFANSHLASSVAQPDGKIIAIDTIGIVRRFNTDGSLDQNFGNNGVAQISGFQQTIEFDDVALQKDGSIVIAGALNGKAAMYRFSSAGVVDATLNNGLGVQPGGMSGQATSVIVQGDGKILLAALNSPPATLLHSFFV